MSNVDEPYLREVLNEYFGLEDLRVLCHDLGVDHELFSDGAQKISRIIDFIAKIRREGKLETLVHALWLIKINSLLKKVKIQIVI